jgi:hypothetical protein
VMRSAMPGWTLTGGDLGLGGPGVVGTVEVEPTIVERVRLDETSLEPSVHCG